MSEIRNRFTGEVMFSGECTLAELVQANRADLSRADLSGANLSGAKTESTRIPAWTLVVPGSRHVITAYPDRVLIGCHSRDIDSWLKIYAEVGRREGYDDAAILEYGEHLRRIKAINEAWESGRAA